MTWFCTGVKGRRIYDLDGLISYRAWRIARQGPGTLRAAVLPTPSAPGQDRRIAGLDEWRGVLVLIVMLAHFVVNRLPGLAWHQPYEVLQPLVRQGGAAAATAQVLPSGTTMALQGFALDPSSRGGPGVSGVEVALGGGAFRPAGMGVPLPGMAGHQPAFANAGWSLPLDGAALRPGQVVPVQVRVRRTDGAEVSFAGSVLFRGPRTGLAGLRWPTALAEAAVDQFFVISGFLITLILVRTRGRPGYLRIFWARRALRILPLAWLLIAVAWFAYPALRGVLPGYLFFYRNYTHEFVPMLSPMWSLMVEEQFYVLFPLVCWAVPPRRLWVAVGGICLALAAVRLHLPGPHIDGLYAGAITTHMRALAIGLGCWVALVREGLVPRPSLCAGVFVGWVVLWAVFGGREPLFAPWGRLGVLDPVGLALAVLLLSRLAARGRPGPAWLRFCGVRCYGLYLLHIPVLQLFIRLMPTAPPEWFFAAWFPSVLALAALSFRWLETPLLALAPSYPPRQAVGD